MQLPDPFFLANLKYKYIQQVKKALKKGFFTSNFKFAFLLIRFIVCLVLVHCRIGSLEKRENIAILRILVHCRIGSLEIVPALQTPV